MESFWTLLSEVGNWPLGTAKCLLIAICACATVLFLYISLNFHGWFNDLVELEHSADIWRDEAMVSMATTRSDLAIAKTKIHSLTDEHGMNSTRDLWRKATPVLMLMAKKERSLFKWGLIGMQFGQTLFKFVRGRSKN
jgi:hypothetical protein